MMLLLFQAFALDQSAIPTDGFNQQVTEGLAFADVDLDGDWDVGLAEGWLENNRLWINGGGLQGGTLGVFADETAARLPAVANDSRDVEFADIDADGDDDWYVSNTSYLVAQGDRWWINAGGRQGGQPGYFVDETQERWIGLGSPPSSVAPSALLSGTFMDWAEDGDFADLDNDGDLDLVHSSAGPNLGGTAPTRLFLNDGEGRFEEFNPSGFAVPAISIPSGSPGLWCEGLQQHNTTDVSGAFCDIACTALDVDVADVDGDHDLDLLHGSRDEEPRLFANRLAGSPLAPASPAGLAFRDVTGLAFPAPHSAGSGHHDQDLADLDGDLDLDVLGVNWSVVGFDLESVIWSNGGGGIFGAPAGLQDLATDEHDGDVIDFDNDGDLDLYLANWTAGEPDRLYRNDTAPGGAFQLVQQPLPSTWTYGSDAGVCDTDQDGDYDVLVAKELQLPEAFLRNVTEVPDVSPPRLALPEALGDRAVSAEGQPVRVHVHDNAPDYLSRYCRTRLQVAVGGMLLPELAAPWSGGQVFRGELPGNLVGSVAYRFAATDEHGNTGVSALASYLGSYALPFQSTYGAGTAGLLGGEPALSALSVPLSGSTLHLGLASAAPAGTPAIVAVSLHPAVPPIEVPGLLLLYLAGPPVLVASLALGSGGSVLAIPLGAIPAGVHAFAQGFVLDPTAGGALLASSAGLELVTQ